MAIYIGIDLGTSGGRVCAMNHNQGIVAYHHAPFSPVEVKDGRRMQDPNVWWAVISGLLDQVCNEIDGQQVKRICVDGTSATLLLVDETGKPLTKALMYNDQSSQRYVPMLQEKAPASSCVLSATSSLAKLFHLYDSISQHQSCYALHQSDWITSMLSGFIGVSDYNNCLKLGFDVENDCWPQWFDALDLPVDILPKQVFMPGEVIGPLSSELQQRWNLSEAVSIVAGTTDSTASFIASGASQLGDAVTALGSTLVLKVLCDKPINHPEYGVYSHRLGNLWLVGGASNSGGEVIKQFFSNQQMIELTKKMNPSVLTRLNYYPLTSIGERFPVNDPQKIPVLTPRPNDDVTFFQGILEGISMIEKTGYQLLQQLGAPYPTKIYSTGGGSHNMAWTAIRSQLLQVNCVQAIQSEAAFGAALIAMRGGSDVGF